MSAHTPGPWAVDFSGPARIAIVDSSDRDLALCALQCENGDEDEANALLIAAAPDLLAALEALLKVAVWDNDFTSEAEFLPVEKVARAAIAKAKGVAP